ncbi:hypothetical protein LP52_11675 [Streptomonospora alba]|uniref:Uncharacterized protein n=1 Tax=Streptomonospora alba TaxID=183763 RepID=A0A0C2JBF0_9ACTN|nr:hypothetical protein [Streptomonospora alba]KIH98776.1 hypothetical protein LP52_11675 [Streptomonospora alba]
MPPGADIPDPIRAYLLDRLLVSRWTRPTAWCIATGLMTAPVLAAFIGWRLAAESSATVLSTHPWIAGSVLSGVVTAFILAVCVPISRYESAEAGLSAARPPRPWQARAARLALRRGELSGDAEANRIAAAMARRNADRPFRPWRLRTLLLGMATLPALAFTFAVLDGDMAEMLLCGAQTVLFVVMGTIGLSAENRARIRRRRLLALQAAEAWCAHVDTDALHRGL